VINPVSLAWFDLAHDRIGQSYYQEIGLLGKIKLVEQVLHMGTRQKDLVNRDFNTHKFDFSVLLRPHFRGWIGDFDRKCDQLIP
jgi:hypothetical protein